MKKWANKKADELKNKEIDLIVPSNCSSENYTMILRKSGLVAILIWFT